MAASPRTFSSIEELKTAIGTELGISAWHEVTQQRIDEFASSTEDHFWIHTDPERAASEGPAGTTIAHGLYTLSLGPKFTYELLGWRDLGVAVNYGYDRVRFPTPVPVGSKLRMRLSLEGVEDLATSTELKLSQFYEIEGSDRPACVASALMRFLR
jgi:acyl dehydratase